jgi:hypothetical protein
MPKNNREETRRTVYNQVRLFGNIIENLYFFDWK